MAVVLQKKIFHPLSGMLVVKLKGDERIFKRSELLKKRLAWKKAAAEKVKKEKRYSPRHKKRD